MGSGEILVIMLIALVVLGPEKLPKLAADLGRWVGRARAMARQLRSQLDQEVHLEELRRLERSATELAERATANPLAPAPAAEPVIVPLPPDPPTVALPADPPIVPLPPDPPTVALPADPPIVPLPPDPPAPARAERPAIAPSPPPQLPDGQH